MNTSILEEELAPLNAQIEQARQKCEALEGELRVVEAELKTFSADRQRFDALRDVCNAFDKLKELEADEFFWEGIPESEDATGEKWGAWFAPGQGRVKTLGSGQRLRLEASSIRAR